MLQAENLSLISRCNQLELDACRVEIGAGRASSPGKPNGRRTRTRCQIGQNINQFWLLLGAVTGEPSLHELPYDARLERVLAYGIGIWDVLDACQREGSLDSAIRNAQPNDFASLRQHAPMLRKVCFNGKTAGRFAPVIAAAGYDTLVLPSSSPANAMLSFEQKLVVWREICS